ncbi:UNVERIFIED_CONTAM: hypothetical protein Sradi_4329000 [Sesamum radiatum]|uniref:Pectinesterase inhibitor domain-containing protein n=1 Tax=Sesamum radiatum TaxID=300843 RepID=A0AAW2NND9_SESRA
MAFQDFDLISQRRQEERRRKKKKIIIAVTLSVLILLIAGAAVAVVMYQNNQDVNTKESHKTPGPPKPKAVSVSDKTEKVVRAVCATTDYQKTCEDSLIKSVKPNSTSLHESILRAAFSAASDEIDKAVKKASDLKFDSPLKKKAFEDCLELLEDAKEELNSSTAFIDGKDMENCRP